MAPRVRTRREAFPPPRGNKNLTGPRHHRQIVSGIRSCPRSVGPKPPAATTQPSQALRAPPRLPRHPQASTATTALGSAVLAGSATAAVARGGVRDAGAGCGELILFGGLERAAGETRGSQRWPAPVPTGRSASRRLSTRNVRALRHPRPERCWPGGTHDQKRSGPVAHKDARSVRMCHRARTEVALRASGLERKWPCAPPGQNRTGHVGPPGHHSSGPVSLGPARTWGAAKGRQPRAVPWRQGRR